MSDTTDYTGRPVNVSVRNTTGILELNRPRALNSLNQEMIDIIQETLDAWIDDEAVHRVLIRSGSERGFCAGGDVRAVREAVLAGDTAVGDHYFTEEFIMNEDLGNFPKPVISLIDGVVMGGGLGLSVHGSHRVITERAFAAMPEMAIGYVPDVGFTFAGQRLSTPAVGTFLAVTGWRMSPADMLWAGIATDIIDSADTGAFTQTLIERSLEEALEEFGTTVSQESELAGYATQIEETFGLESWALIDAALGAHPDRGFVQRVRELMSSAAPTSVVATVLLMNANREVATLREALDHELAFALYMIRRPDFAEGVRAVLVDKDRNPAFEAAVEESVLRGLLH